MRTSGRTRTPRWSLGSPFSAISGLRGGTVTGEENIEELLVMMTSNILAPRVGTLTICDREESELSSVVKSMSLASPAQTTMRLGEDER